MSVIKLLDRYDSLKNEGIALSKELHKLSMHQTKSACSTTHKNVDVSYQEMLDRISNEQSINTTLKAKLNSMKALLEKQNKIENELTSKKEEVKSPQQYQSPSPINLYRRKANSSHKTIPSTLSSPTAQDEITYLRNQYDQKANENQEMESEYANKINELKTQLGAKSEEYDNLLKKSNTLVHRKNELQNMILPLLKTSKEQMRKNEKRNQQLKVFTSLDESDEN